MIIVIHEIWQQSDWYQMQDSSNVQDFFGSSEPGKQVADTSQNYEISNGNNNNLLLLLLLFCDTTHSEIRQTLHSLIRK